MSDFIDYRSRFREHERVRKLVELVPKEGGSLLDAGAREGAVSVLLADYFDKVTALDRNEPTVSHAKVVSVRGDITSLQFADHSFDCVVCAEVLEHIAPDLLARACLELQRVSANSLIIGVPYRQDLRVSRTTCHACGGKNPPWGHVNAFDEQRLLDLFPEMDAQEITYVGRTTAATNAVSTLLMDLAGNPYGTYSQEEPCVHCGARLRPPARNFWQKVCTKLAFVLNRAQARFVRPRPNWIHILFRKRVASAQSRGATAAPVEGAIRAATGFSQRSG